MNLHSVRDGAAKKTNPAVVLYQFDLADPLNPIDLLASALTIAATYTLLSTSLNPPDRHTPKRSSISELGTTPAAS